MTCGILKRGKKKRKKEEEKNKKKHVFLKLLEPNPQKTIQLLLFRPKNDL